MYLCKECQKYIRVFELAVRGGCVCGGGGGGGAGKGGIGNFTGRNFFTG